MIDRESLAEAGNMVYTTPNQAWYAYQLELDSRTSFIQATAQASHRGGL